MDAQKVVKTGNIFSADNLSGTRAKHYTDVALTNEPTVGIPSFWLIRYALKLNDTFQLFDKNIGIRQLYPISEMGLNAEERAEAITPKWIEFTAADGQTVSQKDFRDELNVKNYPNGLVFNIKVASTENQDGEKEWQKIGQITLTESVVSESCDSRLHFHHPVFREDIKHQ